MSLQCSTYIASVTISELSSPRLRKRQLLQAYISLDRIYSENWRTPCDFACNNYLFLFDVKNDKFILATEMASHMTKNPSQSKSKCDETT